MTRTRCSCSKQRREATASQSSFVLLVLGSAIALFTKMRRIPLAAAAAAVLLATAVHGLVDVYWVRGTPVLGWLLVGMACGEFAHGSGRRRCPTQLEAVHVVVVAYGHADALDTALAPLAGHVPLTVVDNSSSGSVAAVAGRHGADYLDPGSNRGFGAGVNIALKRLEATSPTNVLLLNPDAVIQLDDLKTLVALRPLIRHARSHRPPPPRRRRERRTSGLALPVAVASMAGGRRTRPFPWGSVGEFVIGAVLLLDWDAIREIGFFDERFFLYCEETDWQRRAADAGWHSASAPRRWPSMRGPAPATIRRDARLSSTRPTRPTSASGSVRTGWWIYRAAAGFGARVRAVLLRGERRSLARRRSAIYIRGPRRSVDDLSGRMT